MRLEGFLCESSAETQDHKKTIIFVKIMIFDKLDSIWILVLIIVFMYFVFRLARSYMYMRMRRAHRLTGVVSKPHSQLNINLRLPLTILSISANASK